MKALGVSSGFRSSKMVGTAKNLVAETAQQRAAKGAVVKVKSGVARTPHRPPLLSLTSTPLPSEHDIG